MSGHPLGKARELSAIVDEDKYNLLIDLTVSGKIDGYSPTELKYLVWNKEEDQAFGIVKGDNTDLILSFVVPHLGHYKVTKADTLKKAANAWRRFSRSMMGS